MPFNSKRAVNHIKIVEYMADRARVPIFSPIRNPTMGMYSMFTLDLNYLSVYILKNILCVNFLVVENMLFMVSRINKILVNYTKVGIIYYYFNVLILLLYTIFFV